MNPVKITVPRNKKAVISELTKQVESCTLCRLKEGSRSKSIIIGNRYPSIVLLTLFEPSEDEKQDIEAMMLGLGFKNGYSIVWALRCKKEDSDYFEPLSFCSVYTRKLVYTLNPIAVVVFGLEAARSITTVEEGCTMDKLRRTCLTDPFHVVFTHDIQKELDENEKSELIKDLKKVKSIVYMELTT